MSLTELMGVHEAAQALGISRARAHQLIQLGRITPAGRIGKRGQYVFAAADIEELANVKAADDAL